jgi:hypothetical protein
MPDSVGGIGDLSYSMNSGVEYHGMLESNKTADRYALFVEPNPFNSACKISTPDKSIVEIFDIAGRSVAELKGGDQIWRPDNKLGSGVYLVRATIGTKTIEKRVVYLK